jgi:gentisate 1,2-dioxygenase
MRLDPDQCAPSSGVRCFDHSTCRETLPCRWRWKDYGPFLDRGADVREALDGLRREKGDPHEGIQVQFVNPATGGPVGPIMNYAGQLLRPARRASQA